MPHDEGERLGRKFPPHRPKAHPFTPIVCSMVLILCSQIAIADDEVRENLLGNSIVYGGFGGTQFSLAAAI